MDGNRVGMGDFLPSRKVNTSRCRSEQFRILSHAEPVEARRRGTAADDCIGNKIGVLALQGDFARHIEVLERIGARGIPVRLPEEIEAIDGLIIPGGESTTMGKLMSRFGVDRAILERIDEGMPVFGTCTGMILLARDIEESDQPRLGVMNMTVRRNAFGRQIDSFETDLDVPLFGSRPIRAVFICAPFVTSVRNGAQVLARLSEDRIVLVREGNCLAAAFHPELTDDTRLHEYFIGMVRSKADAS